SVRTRGPRTAGAARTARAPAHAAIPPAHHGAAARRCRRRLRGLAGDPVGAPNLRLAWAEIPQSNLPIRQTRPQPAVAQSPMSRALCARNQAGPGGGPMTTARSSHRALSHAGLVVLSVAMAGAAQAQTKGGPTPSPPGAAVYFVDIK